MITREWLELHATCGNVGWTRPQVNAIGVRWPLRQGWKKHMVGRVITDEQAREFERLGALRRKQLAKQAIENDSEWGLPL